MGFQFVLGSCCSGILYIVCIGYIIPSLLCSRNVFAWYSDEGSVPILISPWYKFELESFCGPHQTWIITDTVEVEFLLPFLSPSLCAPHNLIKAAVERATIFFLVVTRKLSLSVFIGKRKENLNFFWQAHLCISRARVAWDFLSFRSSGEGSQLFKSIRPT